MRENGLTVLEEVCPLSARVVVNQVSMKMENERITKLIRDLKKSFRRDIMRILKLTEDTRKDILQNLLKRSPNNYGEFEGRVNAIIEEVRNNRDQAVFNYTKQFDGADINAGNILVTEEEIAEAYEQVDTTLLAVIRKSLVNIKNIMKTGTEFLVYDRGRYHSWTESYRTCNGWCLCSGRKGRVSFFRTDECSSGKSCGSRPYCNVYATRQRWKSISFHSGCSQRSRS